MPPLLLFDPGQLDLSRVLLDRGAIRKINAKSCEMEQLTAIVYMDTTNHIIAGYKDVGADEFWVRGHMPGYPLLPGVLICEAAAQMCSYYSSLLGLGGEGNFI